jgi:hypothetical protein
VDRATTTRESDTVQFAKKEIGLMKAILLLINNRFVSASAQLGVVEGHISEEDQNGSTNNKMSALSSIPWF